MKTITCTYLRLHTAAVCDEAVHEPFLITRYGKPVAVLIGAEEYLRLILKAGMRYDQPARPALLAARNERLDIAQATVGNLEAQLASEQEDSKRRLEKMMDMGDQLASAERVVDAVLHRKVVGGTAVGYAESHRATYSKEEK